MTFRPRRSPQLVAHMGDSARHPANTLAAVESAISHGADMVEVDVSITADGVLVATHGPRLDHWTDGTGHVHRTESSVIEELRARLGAGGDLSEEPVPLLRAVLDAVARRVPLNLDVKRPSAAAATIAEVSGRDQAHVVSGLTPRHVRRVLRDHPGTAVLVNLSRLDKLVARLRWLRTRWLCRAGNRRLFAHPDVVALNLNHRWVDAALVAAVHDAGAQVWVFTVDTEAQLRAAAAHGVDSITVDDLTLLDNK